VRQSIRGYADGIIEAARTGGKLAQTAAELAAVRDLIGRSEDLAGALVDPGVPVPARRAVLSELLTGRVGAPALSLLTFAVDSDRAPDLVDDVAWLATRTDAASRDLRQIDEVMLGHKAAEERVGGYASAVLEDVEGRPALAAVEDELFRFGRVIDGSEELRAALSDRGVPAQARKGLVEDLLDAKASPATVRLAAYATQVGRPRDYEALLGYLAARVAAEGDRRVAEVRTAVDIDDAQRSHLADALSRLMGHNIEVRATVDPNVLGGFLATIGDTVVDGSARHRLDVLRERLVQPGATITTGDRI
jgi:F-type H+-transporting ATPase subunit delta